MWSIPIISIRRRSMSFLILTLLSVAGKRCWAQEARSDPAPIIYPGQVNIGLLSSIHAPGYGGTCGALRPDAVQRAMAAVWAAHQANFRKVDPHELNLGIYIFDTCGQEDVAERQVYRLLGHVGHVQTTDCSEKRIPPLFAVITEGDPEHLKVPLKLLNVFSVPVVTATGPPLPHSLSTAPSSTALARAAVHVLRKLRLAEVAVIAEDDAPVGLFGDFSQQARGAGMQAVQLDEGRSASSMDSSDDFLGTLTLLSQYGKSRLKAVVFLVSPSDALQLLRSVDDSRLPQIPWVIVTTSDITREMNESFAKEQIGRLSKVLVLSPENTEIPEFEQYFQQLLNEDTVKYHPLLIEFLQTVSLRNEFRNGTLPLTNRNPSSNITFHSADVSATVKAVWTLSTALQNVQKRSCRRGTDCLLYLRRSLSAYVAKAAATLDQTVHPKADHSGVKLKFKEDGELVTVRYNLRGFSEGGDVVQVGFYSDEEGLKVNRDILMPYSEFIFVQPLSSPSTSTSESTDSRQEVVNATAPAEHSITTSTPDYTRWKILDDVDMPVEQVSKSLSKVSEDPHQDLDLVLTLHDDKDLQVLSGNESSKMVARGPTYTRGDPDIAASNMRSISLSSHQEPTANKHTPSSRSDKRVDILPSDSAKESPEDVKVERSSRSRHVSAWLGRPWALSVLGVCGFLILITLYVLVFLMVKACEGTLKKTNCCLSLMQLLSLLCLYFAAGLYTWKPSELLCGLHRLMPNISLAFCYGCLLLKGMHLRAQNSLGLGGSINSCNQMLTLFFVVGVQVALETQWWLLHPPTISLDPFDCLATKREILQSQVYVAFLLIVAMGIAVSTRKIPYNQPESRSLIATTLLCMVVFLAWIVACWLLPNSGGRNIAAPVTLLSTALSVLVGVFGPQLFAIHKYGGFPHKPLSYADSLSTVFTMFKDLDGTSTTSRGKKTAKTLETPFAEMSESTRNPLYSDYQSAYP